MRQETLQIFKRFPPVRHIFLLIVKYWWENLLDTEQLEDLSVNGRIISKRILKEQNDRVGDENVDKWQAAVRR